MFFHQIYIEIFFRNAFGKCNRIFLKVLIIVVFCSFSNSLYSQDNSQVLGDSVVSKVRSQINLDSLPKANFHGKDSTYHSIENQLDSATSKFNTRIDSLKKLNLPDQVYVYKLDSAYNNFRLKVVQRFKQRYDSLGAPAHGKLSKMDSIVYKKTYFLDSLLRSNNVKGIGKISDKFDANLPDVSSMPNTNIDLPSVNNNLPGDMNLGAGKLNVPNDVGINTPNLNNLEGVPDIEKYTNTLKTVSGSTDEIKKGAELKNTEKLVEQQALKVDEVDALNKQNQTVESLKKQGEGLKDLNKNPDSLQSIAKKELVDHFAGKEELVKKDMAEMAKLQNKYRNVADSRFLPKRPPNEMKNKPFVERLIPGVNFQIFPANDFSFDIAPFIGYRISGRLRAGVGAYWRLKYIDNRSVKIKAEDIYGFRVYGNYKFIKNFYTHLEIQCFKENRELSKPVLGAESKQGWRNRLNFGIYRTYKINKHLNGSLLVMYDLLMIRQFPNSQGAAVRFGFDYQIRKKKKQ